MGRASTILGRFPAHFEAARPGKLLGAVVAALARDIDVQAAQLAGIRRAHRVREADTVGDLLRIGALHGIRAGEMDVLFLRLALAAERIEALEDAEAADRPARIADLLALWPLDLPEEPLVPFTPAADLDAPAPTPEEAADAALEILLAAASAATRHGARRVALSNRIIRICRNHAQGNGTVRAMLEGAATALDLDILAVFHSDDRYLHAAETRDRLSLAPAGVPPVPGRIEVLGLEENPLRRAEQPPAERRHGECFEILRKGFDPARLEIGVTAEGDRTIGPMIVNRDQGPGRGLCRDRAAGPDADLQRDRPRHHRRQRRHRLCLWLRGRACSPTRTPRPPATPPSTSRPSSPRRRRARWTVALRSRMPGPACQCPRWRSAGRRWRSSCRRDILGSPGKRRATPSRRRRPCWSPPRLGRLQGSSPARGPRSGPCSLQGPGETRTTAALVSFAWREHEAYKVRVLIPPRFRALSDDPDGVEVTRRVTDAVDRFRPIGVAVETVFTDERWVLGQGMIADEGSAAAALLALSGGTVLWPAPEEPGPPDG